MPIDILAGSDGLRRAVDAGASPQEVSVVSGWMPDRST